MAEINQRRILWIAWETQRRSTTLANKIGADLHQFNSGLPRLLRYAVLSLKTLRVLLKKKYELIFTQNPSIILCFLIVTLKSFMQTRVIVDAHTPYLKLTGLRSRLFKGLTRFIFHGADLVIVTNARLRDKYLLKYPKAKFFVLPDKIPQIEKSFPGPQLQKLLSSTSDGIKIVLICTYANDEPYHEVFKAMRYHTNSLLYVTGDKSKVPSSVFDAKPENVILTGFLDENDYAALLHSVDLVMDLTKIEDNMVCGAYEGLAAGKPMILSKKKVLIEYFSKGVIHTENRFNKIAEAIELSGRNIQLLQNEIGKLRDIREKEWKTQWNDFLQFLSKIPLKY